MVEMKKSWWAPLQVAVGEGWRWQLGPLDIQVYRAGNEWHVSYERGESEGTGAEVWSRELSSDLPEDSPNIERFAPELVCIEAHYVLTPSCC